MNILGIALLCTGILLAPTSATAAVAQAELYGLSLRVHPGTAKSLGLNYSLALTSDPTSITSFNGELALLPAEAEFTHASFYRLEGDIFFEPIYGMMLLDVPANTDTNDNGIPEFFEIGEAVEGWRTEGVFQDERGQGPIDAVWSRAAGSAQGTVQLTLGIHGTVFTHTFDLNQFRGTLNYTVSGTNITASVLLTNALDPQKTLRGPAQLQQVNTNQLVLLEGSWTNETQILLEYEAAEDVERFGNVYMDFLFFQDGDPSTATEDYVLWMLRIVDPNDSDQDGIPDLSDDAPPVVSQPVLGLSLANNALLLTVQGEAGQSIRIESTPALGTGTWEPAATVTLTNLVQTLTLPVPSGATAFWRARSP